LISVFISFVKKKSGSTLLVLGAQKLVMGAMVHISQALVYVSYIDMNNYNGTLVLGAQKLK
jgi:hypothetical protein